MNRPSALSSLLLAFTLPLAACGDEAAPQDAGQPDADTADMSTGPEYPEGTTCANAMRVEGTESAMTLSFDTTDMPSGARDLGLFCGNPDAPRWAPQWVIEYAVPGTGLKALEFSTAVNGTRELFDTVVQARTSCETVPANWPPSCFDNIDPNSEIRSSGAITALGGTTVYLYVTGYTDTPYGTQTEQAVDRGEISIRLRARTNTAPVAAAVDFQAFGDRYEIAVDGTDAEGDAFAASLVFRDAEGNISDVNGDGRGDANDQIALGFTQSLASTFSGTLLVDGDTFAAVARTNPASVTVAVLDRGMALGNEISGDVRRITEVTIGETCSLDTPRCFRPLTCEADICTVPPALEAACATATPIAIDTPAPGTSASATVTGSISAGDVANFTGSCGPTGGPEKLFTVAIPAEGAFDLIVRTNVAGSAANADTILYVRETCAVPATQTGCNDDINYNGNEFRSRVETRNAVPGSTYTVFVEPYNAVSGASLGFGLEAQLRPVLASGAECDRSGATNRCAGEACPASGTAVCP